MKTLLLAGATVALLTTVNLSPAIARGPKLAGGDTGADTPIQRISMGLPVPTRSAGPLRSVGGV